jgi:hypothetical protein
MPPDAGLDEGLDQGLDADACIGYSWGALWCFGSGRNSHTRSLIAVCLSVVWPLIILLMVE